LLVREARATLRDPFTVTILIVVPLTALLVFGFVLSTEVQHLALGVHDASGTAASRRLIADLAAKGTFTPRRYATREALDRALIQSEVSVALVIPPDFDGGLNDPEKESPRVQVIYDGGEAQLAGNAEGFMRSLVAATGAKLVVGRSPGGVDVMSRALFNPKLAGTPFMVAGTYGFVLSFLTTLITAVSVVNERLAGTFEQLQVTPATSVEILLGKLLPLGAVFTFDVLLMAVVAGLALGVWPAGSLVFFVVASSFYVLVSLALGLVISATSKTANEAVQKTVLTSIPLIQLSGFAFPIRNMPYLLQWAVEIFPATHYIRLSRAIYLRAEGPLDVWPDLLFIFVFGALFLAMGLRSLGARV
jgi:ABC-2 type transport system permease protein